MHEFNIENLEGKRLTAKVIDTGATFYTYQKFADAAGHPEATSEFLVIRHNVVSEGETVDLLAKGDHEISVYGKVYVAQTKAGDKFLIGERGIEINEPIEPTLQSATHDELLAELQRRLTDPVVDELIGFDPFKTRESIVKQAKEDVEGLVAQSATIKANFEINREKNAVTALVRGKFSGRLIEVGVAKCDPNDCFNEYIGKAIALRRALGYNVPSDYLNAPQPEGVEVGDVIEHVSVGGTTLTRTVDRIATDRYWFTTGTFLYKDAQQRYGGRVINAKTIDDTARYNDK